MSKSKWLLAAVSAVFVTAAAAVYADDPVKTGPIDKPGRAIDDGSVKAGSPKKYGREIDDGAVRAGGSKKYGREIDEGKAVKSGPVDKHGRALNDEHKSKKKGKKQPIDQ